MLAFTHWLMRHLGISRIRRRGRHKIDKHLLKFRPIYIHLETCAFCKLIDGLSLSVQTRVSSVTDTFIQADIHVHVAFAGDQTRVEPRRRG